KVTRATKSARLTREMTTTSQSPLSDHNNPYSPEEIHTEAAGTHTPPRTLTTSPLTSPPEYLDDRSSPRLTLRIIRKVGDHQEWPQWEKEGLGDRERENS